MAFSYIYPEGFKKQIRMNIECEFDTGTSYRCVVFDKEIPENMKLNFIGTHYNGRTHNDVKEILFNNCKFTKVPQNLTRSFPNLNKFANYHSNLKNLAKADLKEYKNFTEFYFINNQIEFLPGDLFEDCRNLEKISFGGNRLILVEPNILDGLTKLKSINLNGDTEYGCFDSNLIFSGANATLDLIKSGLFVKFFKHKEFVIKNFVRKLQMKLEESRKLTENLLQNDQNILKPAIVAPLNPQNVLYNDIKAFIQDENTKDFQIQIENHEFPVHKFLLAARSPTLAKILKKNPEVENLNLVDISVETFVIILKFLYTDELPGDDETNFLQLFAAAGKLKIEKLKDFAAEQLTNTVDTENALEIFKIACKYGNKELKQKTFKLLKEKYPGSKFKDEWIDDAEKVEKLISYLKKMEEMEKSLEDMM